MCNINNPGKNAAKEAQDKDLKQQYDDEKKFWQSEIKKEKTQGPRASDNERQGDSCDGLDCM